MRRTHLVMGMGLSVDIPDCNDEVVYNAVFERFTQIDERFSTYKPGSELSKYCSGKIGEDDLSAEMRKIIAACKKAEHLTNGYFSAWYDEKFDPSGYVKGWAIGQGGEIIEKAGYKVYCLGAGGDILASSNNQKVWNIGIQDPTNKKYLTSQVFLKNAAVATSGNYERGEHIINPKTRTPATDLLSVSVIGPDIILADVLATAAFAAGNSWRQVLEPYKAYEALAIDSAQRLEMSAGMKQYLTQA